MKKVDMSEKAILRRLNQTEQLREVSLFLMKAKKLQDEKSNGTKTNAAETKEFTNTVKNENSYKG